MTDSITGELIPLYGDIVLLSGLKLEAKGLKKRGRSSLAITKKKFGWQGNRSKIIELLSDYIEAEKKRLAR